MDKNMKSAPNQKYIAVSPFKKFKHFMPLSSSLLNFYLWFDHFPKLALACRSFVRWSILSSSQSS